MTSELVRPQALRMNIVIAEMPVTTPDQSRKIQETLSALAIDKTMRVTFSGTPGSFEFSLIMLAEKPRDAALLFESTLIEMCVEMTGKVPRLESMTTGDTASP